MSIDESVTVMNNKGVMVKQSENELMERENYEVLGTLR